MSSSSETPLLRPRRQSRTFAFQMLYQFQATREPIEPAFARFWESDEGREADEPMRRFALLLASLAVNHLDTIDGFIEQYARQRPLHRIGAADLALLRLGCAEMFYIADIPPAVTINEIVELGRLYGAEESPSFLNAVLDRVKGHRDEIPESAKVASQWS